MNITLTLEDVQALVELAERCPKSGAEGRWLRNLVAATNQAVGAAQKIEAPVDVPVATPQGAQEARKPRRGQK